MRLFMICLLAMLTVGCCRQEGLSSSDRHTVEQEVRTMLQSYFDDIRSGGLTQEFRYLDDSEDFFWIPPGYESALTFDSVRTVLTRNALLISSADFTWERLRVIPVSERAASYTGIVKGLMIDTSGTATSLRMLESGVVIRRTGGWKLLCGQTRIY